MVVPGEARLSQGEDLMQTSSTAEDVGDNRGLKRAIWLGYSARENVDATSVRGDFKVEGPSPIPWTAVGSFKVTAPLLLLTLY